MSCSTQTHRLDHYIRCLLKRGFFMSVTYSQSRSLILIYLVFCKCSLMGNGRLREEVVHNGSAVL